jgi:hypothetical protein
MPMRSDLHNLNPKDLESYGFARVRDKAFDAVQDLWRRRVAEGWKQADLATAVGKDTAWICRKLRGPGNWTFRTFGALVQAMKGDVEITVHAMEDAVSPRSNYHSYAGYEAEPALDEVATAPLDYSGLSIKPKRRSMPTESGELPETAKVVRVENAAL